MLKQPQATTNNHKRRATPLNAKATTSNHKQPQATTSDHKQPQAEGNSAQL
jgi:hypothetical protein